MRMVPSGAFTAMTSIFVPGLPPIERCLFRYVGNGYGEITAVLRDLSPALPCAGSQCERQSEQRKMPGALRACFRFPAIFLNILFSSPCYISAVLPSALFVGFVEAHDEYNYDERRVAGTIQCQCLSKNCMPELLSAVRYRHRAVGARRICGFL